MRSLWALPRPGIPILVAAVLFAALATGCGLPWLRSPSLEEMAGQMILCGFRGTGENADELGPLLDDIAAGRVGGVILFERDALLDRPGRNIVSLEQVTRLTALLQSRAKTPLFVGIDQEGGRVRRLREEHGAPFLPSAAAMGQEEPRKTRLLAERTGRMLRKAGVNLDFAPSLDVNVNPASPAIGAVERSFSADPEVVAAHGLAFAKGLAATGVIPCYKHFPGHGSAARDTHLGFADVTATWSEAELAPYRHIFARSAEAPKAMVMPGHIMHRQLGGEMPCSLSPAVVTGLLRRDLNWQGVIITDDLDMRAVTDAVGGLDAVKAGAKAAPGAKADGSAGSGSDAADARAKNAGAVADGARPEAEGADRAGPDETDSERQRRAEREIIRRAVLAGADVLLFGNNLRYDALMPRRMHALLLELVRDGDIGEERIRTSYRRIMELKKAYGLN